MSTKESEKLPMGRKIKYLGALRLTTSESTMEEDETLAAIASPKLETADTLENPAEWGATLDTSSQNTTAMSPNTTIMLLLKALRATHTAINPVILLD